MSAASRVTVTAPNEADSEAQLKVVFDRIDKDRKGYLTPRDIALAFRAIGVRISKTDVEEAVWEVDINSDGILEFGDIVDIYDRAPYEQSEFAPTKVLNLIEFLMYDTDFSGDISVEDCMVILCRRFDETGGEAELRKFLIDTRFAASKKLSFAEFLRQIDIRRKLLNM